MVQLSNRCLEITKKGSRCKKRKMGDLYCGLHHLECSICYDEVKNKVSLGCNHSFCKDCIYRWIVKAGNCPMCRSTVRYPERLDAINHNTYNGTLITVLSYRFTLDQVLFPEFLDYVTELIEFDEWVNHQDWEVLKIFLGIDEHIYRIFRSLPVMKFVHYIFVDEYTDEFPVEIDENEVKNVYKYKIELI